MPGNDPSINNPYVYKHVYKFKPAIVLSAIVVEMDIVQVAVMVMIIVSLTGPLSKWHQRYVKNGYFGKQHFVKKLQNLCSLDHPILFNFTSLW